MWPTAAKRIEALRSRSHIIVTFGPHPKIYEVWPLCLFVSFPRTNRKGKGPKAPKFTKSALIWEIVNFGDWVGGGPNLSITTPCAWLGFAWRPGLQPPWLSRRMIEHSSGAITSKKCPRDTQAMRSHEKATDSVYSVLSRPRDNAPKTPFPTTTDPTPILGLWALFSCQANFHKLFFALVHGRCHALTFFLPMRICKHHQSGHLLEGLEILERFSRSLQWQDP